MEKKRVYLFIDESGDASFYAKRNKSLIGCDGFMPNLFLGMIIIENKKLVRKAVLDFMNDIKTDFLYNTLPCIKNKKDWYLHASYDNLEIQIKFIDFLRKLDGFKFYCVIGRKRLDIFHNKHNKNETEFYFDLVSNLLKERLNNENDMYQILLSARNKSTQQNLQQAIEKTIIKDNSKRDLPLKINYKSDIVRSCDTPELSIVDYLLWVLQRYIYKGDKRFFTVLESKFDLIIDLYDFEVKKQAEDLIFYNVNNPFDIEKASQFKSNGYI